MNKDFKIGDYVRVSNFQEVYWRDFIETNNSMYAGNRTIQVLEVKLDNNKAYKVSDIRDNYLILDGVGHCCTTTVSTTLPTFNKNYFVEDVRMLRKEKLIKINSIF